MDDLTSKLESLLFVASKPVSAAQLAKLCDISEVEAASGLKEIQSARQDSGIVLMEAAGNWQLSTNPKNIDIVKAFLTQDLREKLTDATVEVLGIIAYRQPISKNEIEAIRGVNCQYSIRQLLMRGLIEKTTNPNDSRSNYYQVTTEFLQHMGLQTVADLPEFSKLTAEVKLPSIPQTATEQTVAQSPTPSTDQYQDPVSSSTFNHGNI